jgi:outer membrane receptor protein involved in Fe transport
MEREPQSRGRKKDRTGAWISAALHVLVIAVIAYFISKTELGREIKEHLLGGRRVKEVKEAPKPPPAQARPKGALKPPPGAPPPARRAAEAPTAVGESFFTEERKTKSEMGRGAVTNAPVAPPPPPKPLPKVFSAAPQSSIKQLLEERAKSSSVLESFGAEQISKSGVSDVGDIVGKISGATVAEGKFAVVRGLADRYTLSTLNGVDIPSADPDRRAAQLDLFPAQFLNRVDVSKTFQPDMPGGFAGGAVNIVTRTFPERPIFAFSVGTAYNTQASLKDDFLFTDQGSTDWLAIDDETREMPTTTRHTNPAGTGTAIPRSLKDDFRSQQFAPAAGDSPLNSSMSLAFGDTTHLFGRPFGFLGGINYKTEYSHYDDGRVIKVANRGLSEPDDEYVDVKSSIEYTWGSLATLAYQISDNHELSFNYMFVQTAEDEARRLRGQNATVGTARGESYHEKDILHWTERNLTDFQLKGSHFFPDLGETRLDWVGSRASTSQTEPDHRIFQFLAQTNTAIPGVKAGDFTPNSPAQPGNPTRLWRSLQEDNNSFRADLTIPLLPHSPGENAVKIGYYISKSEQSYESRAWEIRNLSMDHPFRTIGDPDLILDPRYLDLLEYYNFPANFNYMGEQKIEAEYAMGTWSPFEWLKMVGGVRYESTELAVSTINPTLGGAPSDAAINQKDVLPAVSGTLKFADNVQLRAAYSQTIIRPTYREISEAEVYDIARGRTISGNPELTLSSSDNYDMRLEWYPRPGELVSLGAFYKKLESPIELAAINVQNENIVYTNYTKADVYGFEIELRKNFSGFWGAPYDQFSLGFNYAYIKSEVPRTADQMEIQEQFAGTTSEKRPLYDQPEYVINADLTWDCFLSGTSVTISGGVVGRRLVLVGLSTPDEFEEPAPQLEFSISQRLGRHWKVRFSAKNLLDPVYETTQEFPIGRIAVKSNTKGMQFGLSVGAEF